MKFTTIAGFVLIAALLISCTQSPTGKVTKEETITLGASLPLTGEATSWGQPARGAIQMAVDEANAAGGINGKTVRVIFEDDKCTNAGVTTISKLINVDKIDALIGPVCSAAAGPGLPVAQQNKIPTIIMGSAPHLTLVGDHIFRVYPSDAFAGTYMAEHLHNTLGIKKVAVVFTQNDWGQGIRDTFVKQYKELGGVVLVDEGVKQTDRDMRTIATKILAKNPEAVVAPAYPANAGALVRQLRELNYDKLIFGGDAWETDEYRAEPATVGTQYIVADIGESAELNEKVAQYTDTSNHLIVPLAYDATRIMLSAIEEANGDMSKVRDILDDGSWKGYSSSTISFDENGDLETANYLIKEVREEGPVVIG